MAIGVGGHIVDTVSAQQGHIFSFQRFCILKAFGAISELPKRISPRTTTLKRLGWPIIEGFSEKRETEEIEVLGQVSLVHASQVNFTNSRCFSHY
jgi:hypothetical protein